MLNVFLKKTSSTVEACSMACFFTGVVTYLGLRLELSFERFFNLYTCERIHKKNVSRMNHFNPEDNNCKNKPF